ncbi:MAG TPA: AmmeMemoRadiSam system radical SAM enzyme [Candidatus Omnitrophica bacterium]|nr:AmmeMemoRadiSam system radical SAM enzyme [Candidatus Omnitrophota bacterium]HBG63719.1 AmmeMemoRadiSam system radical SAM enzyme [Candidatus Omnitrophota bacterium]
MITRKEFLKKACVATGIGLVGFDCARLAHAVSSWEGHPALYWKPLENKLIQCLLCPRKCPIPDKKRGFCGVRENNGGSLTTLAYAEAAAVHIDPIEKKPLFHFLPGTTAFSIATAGCNLRCKFCQNWEISQSKPEEIQATHISPAEIVAQAKAAGAKSVAYTYTEPTVFYEYMLDTIKLAREAGLKNVMHSAGSINEEPLRNLCKYLDGVNIDLKAFTQDYYSDICMANLEDILRTLRIIKEEGPHLELTNLVLPGLNDSPEVMKKMCQWIKEYLGADTPLHFSRFWPMYKLNNLSPTPVATLERAQSLAKQEGLRYVYIGNVPGHQGETTFCPRCAKPLLARIGYQVSVNDISGGRCKFCNEKIAGVWS